MDKRVSSFLQKYNLNFASKYFEEIEYETFLLIQPGHTKEIIPNINDRIKFDSTFFEKIETEKQSQIREQEESQSIDIETNTETAASKCWVIEVTQEQAADVVPPKVEPNGETLTSEIDNGFVTLIQHKDLFGLTEIHDMDYDIITRKYQATNMLDAGDRLSLSHCILKYILAPDCKRELSTFEFENLAQTIEVLFPTESRYTFYIPGIKRAPARGKLFQAYKVYREKLNAAGMICRRKRKRNDDTALSEHDDDEFGPQPTEDDENDNDNALQSVSEKLIRFLETHTYPWSEIVSTWEKTGVERDNIFNDSDITVETYLPRFPCLGLNDGHQLLHFDFQRKFSKTTATIEWDKFVSRSLKYGATIRDKTAKQLLRESPPQTKSDECVMALRLLPFLFPVPRGKKKGGTNMSKLEVSKKFVQYFETDADDDQEISDFLSMKIIGRGKHVVCVILGTHKYYFDDVFDALQCCFQLFFTLDVKYPEETASLWDFMNIAFFGLPATNVAPFIYTLLSQLNGGD